MKHIDSISHVKGKSIYLDDINTPHNTHYAHVFVSDIAHGFIEQLDCSEARESEGVVEIFTFKDIPGENQIGAIIKDEPLLAEKDIHFIGQPIALVIAKTKELARKAAKKISLVTRGLPPITDARKAFKAGHLIMPPRTFQMGNTASVWAQCAYIVEGKAESPGQEHLYLETQGAFVEPGEKGRIKIYSSTQGPTAVQRICAVVLGIPMHLIEVDVLRLGGGFGGKEDQATPWAVLAALACQKLNIPIKLILSREEDILLTGKRHPYSSDFKIGLSRELKIMAFEVDYFQNAGAAADLSPAIVERTLFHSTGSYYIPNTRASAYSCRTNLPPNTAFRGFGAPQAFFVIESAIAMAAEKIGVPVKEIQKKNLIEDNQAFPFGQITEEARAEDAWALAEQSFAIDKTERGIRVFNDRHFWQKQGMAMIPICFGVSFTNTMMNHARALVHIYNDGSVGISTAAVEMGQGVNTKMLQVAARTLSVGPHRIKIESTNTTRVANSSPTAASSAVDLNGNAVKLACESLKQRLREVAAKKCKSDVSKIDIIDEIVFNGGKKTGLNWLEIVQLAFTERMSLSEVGHYATPNIFFDKRKEKGHPFAYHVYGNAACVVELDCLRGTYEIKSIEMVHDFGKSMNTSVDKGQVEGALLQGIGWMTMEDVRFDENGGLLSNALSNYKIPDILSTAQKTEIVFLPNSGQTSAIFQSKAIGEPPFLYGLAVFFAIQNAIRAFNPDYKIEAIAPLTPEKVLLSLYGYSSQLFP